jgi:cytidyltransferase-like protein
MKSLLTEGGAAGHMAHPFDLDYVKTGKDLLSFFTDKVPEYLKTNDPHIKTDGVNVSFKLVSKTSFYGEEKREFAVDRGSKKAIDIEGITIDRIGERFAEGHGMRPAITDLLTALNATLESGTINEELKALGMWDNQDYFLNTEYVKEEDGKPVNVIKYGEDFIAFHGVNEFFMKPSPTGVSMSRKSKEVAPTKNSSAALASFTNKVRRYARGYMVYGPDDTKAGKRKGNSINFDSALSERVTVFLSEGTETTDTIGGWLRNPNTKNPFDATIVLADGRKMGAMSKHVYFSLVLDKMPVSELLGGMEGDKQQMAIDAINGAVFYHATRLLGKAVLESLYASFGGHTADKHEGIVMRSKEAFGVTFPIKITGDFIYTGAGGTISQKMAKEEPPQVEAGIKRKIAVFPGAFKPPHRGHMDVVEHFAGIADQVVILISPLSRKTPAGKEINKSVSEKIWQIYIDAKGIGNKVSIGSSPYNSPVQASFEVLKGNVPDFVPELGDLIIPVASDKPDKGGKPDYERFLKFHEGLPDMVPGVIPANIEEYFYKAPSEGALSASAFRAALDTGEGLEAFLPTAVSAQKVFEALGVELETEPEVVEPEVDEPEEPPLPFFMGESLDAEIDRLLDETCGTAKEDPHLEEEELEEMSSSGAVGGYAGPAVKKKKSSRREEEPMIEEVLNYLLGRLEILR